MMGSTSQSPIAELLDGRIAQHVCSYVRGGPFKGGISSCSLAALNAVRIVLGREKSGLHGTRLLEQVIHKDTIDEIVAICARWASELQLEVDDIASLPLFKDTLTLSSSDYNQAEPSNFRSLLSVLEATSRQEGCSAAAVIARPPETFVVFHILTPAAPRPALFALFDPQPYLFPSGTALILFGALDTTVNYISHLLRLDARAPSGGFEWPAAPPPGHYAGHVFLAKPAPAADADSHPHADADADAEHWRALYAANMEVLELKYRLSDAEAIIRALSDENPGRRARIALLNGAGAGAGGVCEGTGSANVSPPVAGPSTRPREDSQEEEGKGKNDHVGKANGDLGELGAFMGRVRLAAAACFFKCAICLETHPEDAVFLVDTCKHQFCRMCMRDFVLLKLEEHRYPMVCPTCQIDTDVKEPGVITGDLIEQLGLTEEQYETWIELELSEFSIVLDCPKCQCSAFVDLDDYTSMKVLRCPLRGCHYQWCKECRQHVEPGAFHSCDGTLELDGLMKSQGWRYCPGCKTPTEKRGGCNHMTCPALGCNSHFCYHCGRSIIRSARQSDVAPALRAHFAVCHMFGP